jgi:glycosyltransferase involved in cell wall biosynthesis
MDGTTHANPLDCLTLDIFFERRNTVFLLKSSHMSAPIVSVITPSFNQAQFLPETLKSVREQTYDDIEHIVVDGGSTDGTLEILRTAPDIRWISEKDRGQVHAINKGFAMAKGSILAWLNSDDTLNPDAVSLAAAALEKTGADLVYGDLEIVDESGSFMRMSYGIPFDFRVLLYGINYIGQQTVFFRRDLLSRAGPLREEFDNGFDYELWLRFAEQGKFAYDPALKAQIRYHAAAKSVARNATTRSDADRIRQEFWSRGGWPKCFSHQPWFMVPNYLYRLKRQLMHWTKA